MNVHCSSIHNSQKRGKQPKHLSTQLINRQHVVYQYNGMLFIQVASLVAQTVKSPPAMWETWVRSLSWENPLEEEMTTQFSILAWRIPWTEETGRPQFMGSQELDTTERLNHHHHHETCLGKQNIAEMIVYLLWVCGSSRHLATFKSLA